MEPLALVGSLADATVAATVAAFPLATRVFGDVLGTTRDLDVEEAAVIESLAYSTLLAGPEFAAWLSGRHRRPVPPCAEPVVLMRSGGTLHVTLNRPDRRNAWGVAVRDAVLDALEIVRLDDTVIRMALAGNGPAFCAGGDLDEFGTTGDPASAHVVRLERHAGLAVHRLADRVRPVLHGACIGAGIEVPAFAAHVVARPDARFRLPEISMGLIPGAGGTVSIARRIGVERTAWWVLSGREVDAATALAWGLVDEVRD